MAFTIDTWKEQAAKKLGQGGCLSDIAPALSVVTAGVGANLVAARPV